MAKMTTKTLQELSELLGSEEIAYKTEVLKDQKQAEVLEDVSLCIAHFCTESNTKGNSADTPEIEVQSPGTLPFVYESDIDPLSGINF